MLSDPMHKNWLAGTTSIQSADGADGTGNPTELGVASLLWREQSKWTRLLWRWDIMGIKTGNIWKTSFI